MCSPMRLLRRGPPWPPPTPPPESMRGQSPRSNERAVQLRASRPDASCRLVPVNHHDVLAHAAVVVGEADGGVGDLARAGVAAQLSPDLGGLRDTGGAERMPAADQTAARIHDDVADVVTASGGHERTRLALGAEAELFVSDQLG